MARVKQLEDFVFRFFDPNRIVIHLQGISDFG
jgi:hypothetical protein